MRVRVKIVTKFERNSHEILNNVNTLGLSFSVCSYYRSKNRLKPKHLPKKELFGFFGVGGIE